jgi:hypothetical protein
MGKRNRWRENRRREADRRLSAVLEANSRSDARPSAPECFADFTAEFRAKIASLRSYALRAPEDWRCRIRSRSLERRCIDLVRFTFARFRVAEHLERTWIEDIDDDFVDRITPAMRPQAPRWAGAPDLRRWHVVAAQGGSLHKLEARPHLSRQETHHLLAAPPEITSAKRAFWYAVARAQCDRVDVALRIARCKVTNYSIASTFWKEVARFFARYQLTVDAMDDLVDFLFAAKREDAVFTLRAARSRRCSAGWRNGTTSCVAARRSAEPGAAARCRTPSTTAEATPGARSGAFASSRPATSCSSRACACAIAWRATSRNACRATARSGR